MSADPVINSNSKDVERKSENIYKSVCHTSPSDTELRIKDRNRLIVAGFICLTFMLLEAVGGFLSNSLAILSDAAHLLADFSSFLVSLIAIWIAAKPRTQNMSFGFYRAEILGALLSILLIWLVTGILVYIAIERIINRTYELNATLMMYVSLAGILANIVMGVALVIYKGDKVTFSIQKGSINVKSAAIHVLGDLVQSVGVFVASIVVYFRPEWKIADPICTFLFSAIVLFTTVNILHDILRVLMEGFPKSLNFLEVKRVLYSVEGVLSVHSLRIWALSMDRMALSAHIMVVKAVNTSEVLRNAAEKIHKQLNIYEVTLQIEEQGDPVCSVCL